LLELPHEDVADLEPASEAVGDVEVEENPNLLTTASAETAFAESDAATIDDETRQAIGVTRDDDCVVAELSTEPNLLDDSVIDVETADTPPDEHPYPVLFLSWWTFSAAPDAGCKSSQIRRDFARVSPEGAGGLAKRPLWPSLMNDLCARRTAC
jgi:hypothetical protein